MAKWGALWQMTFVLTWGFLSTPWHAAAPCARAESKLSHPPHHPRGRFRGGADELCCAPPSGAMSLNVCPPRPRNEIRQSTCRASAARRPSCESNRKQTKKLTRPSSERRSRVVTAAIVKSFQRLTEVLSFIKHSCPPPLSSAYALLSLSLLSSSPMSTISK